MPDFRIRPATRADLPHLTETYNYYVLNTPVTFDVEPSSLFGSTETNALVSTIAHPLHTRTDLIDW